MHVVAQLDVMGGGLAVGMSVGLCSAMGVKFNSVVAFFPFLLLGTSLDDTFLMLKVLQQLPVGAMSPERRIEEMLRTAGPSMLLTTITDIIAFSCGALTSSFPAVQSFCVFAVVGNICDFLLQVTWCVAWASIDAKRQLERMHHAARGEARGCFRGPGCGAFATVFCCLRYSCPSQSDRVGLDPVVELSQHQGKSTTSLQVEEGKVAGQQDQSQGGLVMRSYLKAIRSLQFRVASLLLYCVLLGLAVWGVAGHLKVGQRLSQLVPKDSFLIPYFEQDDGYFSAAG